MYTRQILCAMACVCLLSAAAAAPAQDAATNPPPAAAVFATLVLRDGTRLNGSLGIAEFPLKTAYASLRIPMRTVKTIAPHPYNVKGTVVTCLNDDRLQGTEETAEIPLDSSFGRILVPFRSILSLTVGRPTAARSLLLWNALDGTPSVAGPPVEIWRCATRVDGRAREGMRMAGTNEWGLSFPAGILAGLRQGTIEFWMNVVRKPPAVGGKDGAAYDLLDGPLALQYCADDGAGHGGFCLSAPGHWVYTGPASASRGTEAMGEEGVWNHYAVLWSATGIPSAGGARIALLVNGVPHGFYTAQAAAAPVLASAGGSVSLHRNRGGFAGEVIYDELKVWNCPVEDFAESTRMSFWRDTAPRSDRYMAILGDNSRLYGVLRGAEIAVTNALLGRISVPAAEIERVTGAASSQPARVITSNGDELVGTLLTDPIRFATRFAELQVKAADLVSIQREGPRL